MGALAKVYYYSFGLLAIVGISLLGWALFFSWRQGYEDFSSQLLDFVDKADWRGYFEESVLPMSRFQLLRWILLFLSVSYLLFLRWSYVQWPHAATKLAKISHDFSQSFCSAWQGLKSWQTVVLALMAGLFLIRSIWHIHYYALDYDEAWTYNHFTSKGMLISIISPNNNHILYTILASWADYLPIPTKWAIRLPALLAGVFAFSLLFVFIRKALGIEAALVALAYFAFSSGMNFYSVLGRGYAWQFVFGILMTGATYQILMGKSAWRWKLLYALAFILGIYSNPTFLYLALGLMSLYCLQNCRSLKMFLSFIQIHFLIGIFLVLLHLPLLLTNGFKILVDAAAKSSIASSDAMLYYLHRVVDWLFWGRGSLLFWGYLSVLILLLLLRFLLKLNRSQKTLFLIAFVQLSLPFAYSLMSWTQPPYRIWVYLVVFIGIMLSIWVRSSWGKKPFYFTFLILCVTAASFYASETHYFLNWSAKFDRDAKKMAALLLKKEKLQNCYSFARYDKPLLEFYFLDAGRKFDCWMPFEESKDFRSFAERRYDAVLLDVEDYQPTALDWKIIEENEYQLIYENERVKLFLSPEMNEL